MDRNPCRPPSLMFGRRCPVPHVRRLSMPVVVLSLLLGITTMLLFRKRDVPLPPKDQEVRIVTKVVYVTETPKSHPKTLVPLRRTEYIKVDNMDIIAGDISSGLQVPNIERAQDFCDVYGNVCKGFSYVLDVDTFYPKNNVGAGFRPQSGVNAYIKAEFASQASLPETSKCVVPVAARNWSDECPVPELNPFDETTVNLIHPHGPLRCPGRRFTEYRNGVLRLLDGSAKDTKIRSMSYKSLTRIPHKDWGYHPGEEQKLPTENGPFKINDEFIRVDITSEQGTHTEYHAQVVPSPDVVSGPDSSPAGLPINVMIIGFDSLSQAHFQRAFPEVYKYMQDELQSVFMKGNTIVGDGTTPALAALLTGKFEAELPEARREFEKAAPVDNWPWVFNQFKAQGYATLFSEDAPGFAAFNYHLYGFTEPPTHHYSRYFWQAARPTSRNCIHSKPLHLVHFDYIETFFEAYPSKPKFGLAFLSDISRSSLDSVYVAANDFLKLIKSLHTRNYLKNTMLVVMSDHGFGYGAEKSTLQGKLEEKLPLLSITVPPWFRKKFPQLVRNLEHNANKFSTPFDLHATLQHILSYPKLPQNLKRGRSLFDVIPESRDCSAAGVAEQYCPCVRWQPVDKDHRSIRQAAETAVAHINKLTSSDAEGKKFCAHLELVEVMSGYQKIPKFNMQQYLGASEVDYRVTKFADTPVLILDCMYRVQLRTTPGNALFQAEVMHVKDTFRLAGELSRINPYGDQPKCIVEKSPGLRKYCFCKE